MKIAYLFSRYPVPSQTFCDTEIRALEAAGHEIEIYSCSAPTTSFRHGGPREWPRAEVLYAPSRGVLEAWERVARTEGAWPAEAVAEHTARFGARYDPARRARHALYFADRLRRRGVEHLHVHFANRATHAAWFIHGLTGIPFSFTAHAQDFLVDLGSDELLRLLCEQAAFVVAVSEWSRVELVKRCPAAASKIHRVYNGIALDQWPASSEETPTITSQRLQILSVGRLIDFKGFQDLIAACRLLDERGVRFSCEIVGDGPRREALERQAAEFSHLGGEVRFTGLLTQAEVQVRMRACNVFALASRFDEKGACDVLPTVILEAMAAAKPVVSTRLGGIPEMVEAGKTGLLAAPGDPAGLVDALCALNGRPDERHRLGLAGRWKVETGFSADKSARVLSGLFAEARRDRAKAGVTGGVSGAGERLLCLFDQWPLEQRAGGEPGLEQGLGALRRLHPGVHLLAIKPGELPGQFGGADRATFADALHAVNFLPDSVVLETSWRHLAATAHQLESWRGDLGGSGDPDEFLLACRRALYLQGTLPDSSASGHLHAVGPAAVRCASLLRRMGVVQSASFLLLPQTGGGVEIAGSVLRKLAAAFTGGWVVQERKLAASLGETFLGQPFDEHRWLEALSGWSLPQR